MTTTQRLRDTGDGVRLAQALLRARAIGDQVEEIRLLNTASPAAAKWALAVMVGCTEEAVAAGVRHKPAKIRAALLAGADGLDDDLLTSQVALLEHEAEEE